MEIFCAPVEINYAPPCGNILCPVEINYAPLWKYFVSCGVVHSKMDCTHESAVLDSSNGCSVCTLCGFVLDDFSFDSDGTFVPEFDFTHTWSPFVPLDVLWDALEIKRTKRARQCCNSPEFELACIMLSCTNKGVFHNLHNAATSLNAHWGKTMQYYSELLSQSETCNEYSLVRSALDSLVYSARFTDNRVQDAYNFIPRCLHLCRASRIIAAAIAVHFRIVSVKSAARITHASLSSIYSALHELPHN